MAADREHPKNELEKEFELERVILFSDAVFAIAITLLVIDIRFPEVPKGAGSNELLNIFKPTIFEFLAFTISFFFIGSFWSRHLKLFKFLKRYDQRLVILNLIFLFFIVLFPFTASGIAGHIRPHFMLPLFLYISNITLVAITHYLLCRHVLSDKAGLTFNGGLMEKKYLLTLSLYVAITLVIMLVASILIRLLFPANDFYLGMSFYVFPIMMLYAKRKAKKYKPARVVKGNT